MRARRRFGQNFLADPNAIERIVDALDPGRSEPVLEIGPGRGALTERLLERCDRLAAVEIDRDLVELLRERFPADRLRLYAVDVLELDLEAVLRALGPAPGLAVVGNLPYNISKPVVQHLIAGRRALGRAVLMFQREVAQRLTAEPGGREYGPLGILAGRCFRIRRLFDLPPGAFRPVPEVVSSVTCWTPRENGLAERDESALRRCLGDAFAQRRRTLQNNLRRAWGDARADAALVRAGIPGTLRPEQVDPCAFVELARAYAALDG